MTQWNQFSVTVRRHTDFRGVFLSSAIRSVVSVCFELLVAQTTLGVRLVVCCAATISVDRVLIRNNRSPIQLPAVIGGVAKKKQEGEKMHGICRL